MEDLIIKYIKEINAFKLDMQNKYRLENKDVNFIMHSEYTWVGEVLKIETNFGDKMTIFHEDAREPIRYDYNDEVFSPFKQYNVSVKENYFKTYNYEVIVYQDDKGYFVEENHKKIYGKSIQSLIKKLTDDYDLDQFLITTYDDYAKNQDNPTYEIKISKEKKL